MPAEDKKQIWIDEELHKLLKIYCTWTGRQMQDVATEAVDKFLEENHNPVMFQKRPKIAEQN